MHNRKIFIIYSIAIGLLGSACSKLATTYGMGNKISKKRVLPIEITASDAVTNQGVSCSICSGAFNEEQITTLNCPRGKHQFHTKCIIR